MGKGEGSGKQYFLLFQRCFLPIQKQISIFRLSLFCNLQILSMSDWLKFWYLVYCNIVPDIKEDNAPNNAFLEVLLSVLHTFFPSQWLHTHKTINETMITSMSRMNRSTASGCQFLAASDSFPGNIQGQKPYYHVENILTVNYFCMLTVKKISNYLYLLFTQFKLISFSQ